MGKNIIFGIIWLLLLIFIAWPVAGFCAGVWIFLQVRAQALVGRSLCCHRLVATDPNFVLPYAFTVMRIIYISLLRANLILKMFVSFVVTM
jgi:hypothetical protein